VNVSGVYAASRACACGCFYVCLCGLGREVGESGRGVDGGWQARHLFNIEIVANIPIHNEECRL